MYEIESYLTDNDEAGLHVTTTETASGDGRVFVASIVDYSEGEPKQAGVHGVPFVFAAPDYSGAVYGLGRLVSQLCD